MKAQFRFPKREIGVKRRTCGPNDEIDLEGLLPGFRSRVADLFGKQPEQADAGHV